MESSALAHIKPQAMTPEEIRRMLTEVTADEIERASRGNLTPVKPQVMVGGEPDGSVVRDLEGNSYIDCTSMAWSLNVGYLNSDVLASVIEQIQHLTHIRYPYMTIPRIKLNNRLPEVFPGELTQVILNNQGGGTAVEAAVKMALVNRPGASTIMTPYRGYHGATLFTMTATHYMPVATRLPNIGGEHIVKFPFPNAYRPPAGATAETCGEVCLALLEDIIRQGVTSPVAAIIIEPMQGAGGQIPAPPGYLAGLRELCDRYDILLVFDEAQTAFGRIGWMSGAEYYDVKPDMITLTKGLGGGFPLGALLARHDLKPLTRLEEHSTFGANPVSMAAALANIEVITRSRLPERSRALGEMITARLKSMQEQYEIIGDVRCPGLFIGIELVEDRETKTPATERASAFVKWAMQRGVIFGLDLLEIHQGRVTRANVVKIKPPLVIREGEIERVLEVFEEGIAYVTKLSDAEIEAIQEDLWRANVGG